MKKTLSFLLVLAMVLSSFTFAFAEVETNTPYINGYDDGTFRPGKEVTRQEVAKMLATALGLEAGTPDFKDADKIGGWAKEYVGALQEAEIVEGDAKGNFNPTKEVTRAELAAMLVRAYGEVEIEDVSFNDVPAKAWYADAVKKAASAGFVKGVGNDKFNPNNPATREQTVVMVNRMLGLEDVVGADKLETELKDVEEWSDWAKDAILVASTQFSYEVVDGEVVIVDEDEVELEEAIAKAEKAIAELPSVDDVKVEDKAAVANAKALVAAVKALDEEAVVEGEEVIAELEAKIAELEEAAKELQVVDVSAINAKEIKVVFNKAVDADTVLDDPTDPDTTLESDVFSFVSVGHTNNVLADSAAASLSKDGKTLTIVPAEFFNGDYAVTITKDVKDTDGNAFGGYSQLVALKDEVRPEMVGVTYPANGVAEFKFSEPIDADANDIATAMTITKDEDGSNVTVASTNITVADDKKSFELDMATLALAPKKSYTVKLIGLKDFAGNLLTPNPTTQKVINDVIDDVEPEVVSLEATKAGEMKITFSEKLKDQGSGKIGEYVVGTGTAVDIDITATSGNATVDKTGTVVTVKEDPISDLTGVKKITIQNYQDLSGNLGDAFIKVVEFKEDTTAPKLVKSEVKKDKNGDEYLHLTFDEPVAVGTVSSLPGTQVYDYVTTTGTINLGTPTAVADTDDTEFKVALNTINFTPASGSTADNLIKGAKYTVTLTGGFEDKANNPLGETKISFIREADVATDKPEATVAASSTDNDVIEVQFNMALDGPSANDKDNYSVEGLEVKSATLVPGNKVLVELVSGTNKISGSRNMTISGVKNSDGVVMDTKTYIVDLVENVKPELVSAKFTGEKEITAEFSEEISGTGVFEVYVDGVKLDPSATTPDFTVGTVSGKEVAITLEDEVSLSKTYEVKYVSGIEDTATPANPAVVGTKVTVEQ